MLAALVACMGAGCSNAGARAGDAGSDATLATDTTKEVEAATGTDAASDGDMDGARDTHAAADTSAAEDTHAAADTSAAEDTHAAGDTGADSDRADGGTLSCSSTGPVEPVAAISAYAQWTSFCGDFNSAAPCRNAALLEKVLTCDAALFTFRTVYGTETLRVAERRAATCVLQFWEDREACAIYRVCEVPLPLPAWAGLITPGTLLPGGILNGIEQHCTSMEWCSMNGLCPSPACAATRSLPPTCTN